MRWSWSRLCLAFSVSTMLAGSTFAQKALTWEEVRAKFEAANPTLRAGQIGIDESRAQRRIRGFEFWEEVRAKFEAANPTLRAGQIGIDEAKAQETTAYLRPNPGLTLSTDGT